MAERFSPHDPFLTRKTTIYKKTILDNTLFRPTQFVLWHASDNTSSRNIGGTDTRAVPHLKFFWRPSLQYL